VSFPENFWSHLLELVWAPILAVIVWIHQLGQRVARLETQREAMVEKIDGIEHHVTDSNTKLDKLAEKVDRLVERLL
jgi:uncharacterized coiled-coil protein SlyX